MSDLAPCHEQLRVVSPSDELRSAVGQERLDTLLVVGRLEDVPVPSPVALGAVEGLLQPVLNQSLECRRATVGPLAIRLTVASTSDSNDSAS